MFGGGGTFHSQPPTTGPLESAILLLQFIEHRLNRNLWWERTLYFECISLSYYKECLFCTLGFLAGNQLYDWQTHGMLVLLVSKKNN